MTEWDNKNALRRLRVVLGQVGGPPGLGSASATASALSAWVHRSELAHDASVRVLDAVLSPTPHRIWGDDGSREYARELAIEALDKAERVMKITA